MGETYFYFQQVLKDAYERARAANNRYSLRQFAQKMGINSGTLSLVLKGSRTLPAAKAQTIAELLQLDPVGKRKFIDSTLHYKHARILEEPLKSEKALWYETVSLYAKDVTQLEEQMKKILEQAKAALSQDDPERLYIFHFNLKAIKPEN